MRLDRGAMVLLFVAWACTRSDPPDSSDGSQPNQPASRPETLQPALPLAPVARVETADAWQDLVAQRPHAMVIRDGRLVVELGRSDSHKYASLALQSPWRMGESVDGRSVGILMGISGSLDLPLDGALSPAANPDTREHAGLAMAVTLKPLAPKQSMTVLWGEHPLAHIRLSDDWQRRTFSLPANIVRPGDNRLRFHFRRAAETAEGSVAAAIESVEVGTHEDVTAGFPPRIEGPPFRVTSTGTGSVDLRVPAGTSLVFYVLLPHRARLRLDVRGKGTVEVLVSDDHDHDSGKPPRVLLKEALRPTETEHEVDLAGWGGRPARVELRVAGTGDDDAAVFEGAKILARRSIPLDRRQRRPRDLVVLAIEGARGTEFTGMTTEARYPNVAELAREGLVFTNAHAVGAWAIPNHAAWLSSTPPPVHQTLRGTFIADRQVLLPEALGRRDYFTALVTSNGDVNAERGLYQGFDLHERAASTTDEPASTVVAKRMRQLLVEGHPPLFLYGNVNDPQAPYDPPREIIRNLEPPEGAPLPHLTHIWVGRVRMKKFEPPRAEVAYIRNLYRGELENVDAALGTIIDTLREHDRLEDAIVVVMGIHGEEFLEHGGAGHGHSLYQESIQVPLLIRAPSLLAPGQFEEPVDLLDLAPTLVDLLGMPAPDEWRGESLLPFIDDPQPPPRLVVSYLGDGSRTGRVGPYKLILGPGNAQQFYDLTVDSAEAANRLPTGGVALRMVRNALAWHLLHEGTWRRARWGTGANLRPAFALDLGM